MMREHVHTCVCVTFSKMKVSTRPAPFEMTFCDTCQPFAAVYKYLFFRIYEIIFHNNILFSWFLQTAAEEGCVELSKRKSDDLKYLSRHGGGARVKPFRQSAGAVHEFYLKRTKRLISTVAKNRRVIMNVQ